MPIIVAEDDVIIRTAAVLLDPDTDSERYTAFADYYSVDMPDFDRWVDGLRASVPGLFPAQFRMVRNREELHEQLPDAEGLICQELRVGPEELALASDLRIIQKFGADLRNIDLEASASAGVVVKPLRRRVNIAVAEHAFAMMIAMAKKLPAVDGRIDLDSLEKGGFHPRMYDRRHTASANWARIPGLGTLFGATVGCLGLGEIGREVALRASAFGANVLYHQRNPLPSRMEAEFGATYCSFSDLLENSDYLSIHLPLTGETRGMIDDRALARMKEGAFLINISRAPIIDRDALNAALDSGRLGGVGLDVHYDEPAGANEPLKSYPRALLTPHCAVASRQNAAADMEELVQNLADALVQ